MPSRKPYTRPGQFAARLGIDVDDLVRALQAEIGVDIMERSR